MKVLTVEEAVERVNSGGNLEGVVLDENSLKQVNVRDAMVLSRGGIVIPEQYIYYDDEDIEYDEDIDELTITSGIVELSWEEKAKKAKEYQQAIDQDDKAIASDKAFDGDLVRLETDGLAEAEATLDVRLQLDPAIKSWLDKHSIPVNKLIEQLLVNFYQTGQLIEKDRS